MATRRFKSKTMKFGIPLSVPGPRYVERCYGMHGKSYAHYPSIGARVDLILLNNDRQLRRVPGSHPQTFRFATDDACQGWHILGWRMSDGSMPLGDYDAVDPELAQIDYLPIPNPPRANLGSSTPVMRYASQAAALPVMEGLDIVPWNADGSPEA